MKRLLAGLAVVPLLAGLAHAETFEVTKVEDTDDGVCDADCSLREAIDAANALPGADVVELGPGVHRIAIRALEITDDLELAGAGMDQTELALESDVDDDDAASVERSHIPPGPGLLWRVYVGHGRPDITVRLRDLSMPGIENHATLALERVHGRRYNITNFGDLTIRDSAVTDAYAAGGGGLRNEREATALVERTLFARNLVDYDGGGIENRGTIMIRETIIEECRALGGGGIANKGGDLTMVDSIVRGNRSYEDIQFPSGYGAGIANDADATMRLERVTIADNASGSLDFAWRYAPSSGGISNSGTLEMVNVTVSGNVGRARASYEDNRIGGGPGGMSSSGPLAMTNVTFSHNESGDPPDTLRLFGQITATNVLVDGECLVVGDDDTEVLSLGGNLESPGDGCGFDDPTDRVNVLLPGLDGLEANGGFGGTHALLPFSPALDGGVSEGCPETDQRGVPRADGACDIGAFEYDPEIDAPPPEEPPAPEPPPEEPPAPEPAPPSGGGGGGGGCSVSGESERGALPIALLAAALLARRRRR